MTTSNQGAIRINLDNVIDEIQARFRLTEKELDRAFQQAARRASAVGYDRSVRQFRRLTGEGQYIAFRRPRARQGQIGGDRASLEEVANPSTDPQIQRVTRRRSNWIRNRVFSSVRHTGEGKVWVGLNPQSETGRRLILEFPGLADGFDIEVVQAAMEQVFGLELEKAAIQAVSR